ncbi:MAG: tyrosine-type recombinase/integrase [Actinobacteria bacterium]|nr:tyrosine-type recombinase/integrase [Actinomycetota bacterium]
MPRKVNRNPGITKRGDKWQARAFHDGTEKARTFSTQDEAVRWKREQERAMERGEWIDPSLSSITFAVWSQKWLSAKNDIAASTKRGYVTRLNTHLLPVFGKSKLTSITNNQIGQWIAKAIDDGSGAIVIKRSHSVLRQVLNAAVLDGRLNRNPAIGVPLPRTKSKEKKALSFQQLRALADEVTGYETLILFAGTTGLRWGEIAGLQCKDISLLNRTVIVEKAISTGARGEKIVSPTKTHQVRTVPFPKDLLPEISQLIESKPAESPLFQMQGGGVLDYNNFMSRIFRPAVARTGMKEVGFHTLRHTTASLLISKGAPITAVAGILGHASTQMTLDVYGHLYEDDANKYIDRLGDSLFNTGTDKERTNIFPVTLKESV